MISINLLKSNTLFFSVIIFIYFFITTQNVRAQDLIKITPGEIIQGEPVLIQVPNTKVSDIKKLTFQNKDLKIFNYKNIPSVLIGIDLKAEPRDYKVYLELKNGSSSEEILKVKEREKYQAIMEVPDSLGGNSPANQTKVINTLGQENAVLAVIKTFARALWTNKFVYPVSNPIVTDEYGYSRETGNYTVAHKGVDFEAKVGTKVFAMNRGIVRIAKTFQVYGKTVVVDHGHGVMSFYMHLSKIKVNVGELVQSGQLLGHSGDTGYATGPHLHVTVRINNISIDPIKFLELLE